MLLSGCAQQQSAPLYTSEDASIRNTITAVTAFVDQACFTMLERFYADTVIADYTSLWGGSERKLKNSEIGSAWAGFIPGFDVTHHELRNIRTKVEGAKATATADIAASHWLDSKFWLITGRYHFGLILDDADNAWKITNWRFELQYEAGDRSLVDEAEIKAKDFGPNCAGMKPPGAAQDNDVQTQK